MNGAEPLSTRVKGAREAAGLTQVEAAVAAGIGLTALRNIEQGITTDPQLSTIQSLVRVLDLDLAGLLEEPAA